MVSLSAAYHSSITHVGQLQTDVKPAREASFNESVLNRMRVGNRTVLLTACAEMVQCGPQHRHGTENEEEPTLPGRGQSRTLFWMANCKMAFPKDNFAVHTVT